ncbi:hypothetical protein CK203_012154 [Vitis vinifera]|uniref:Uncharacterized protein n=1 Tax=Vitis vinifera TaxID=29760 RepID=A0A438K0Q8_VITVI|nr:hypothetical protein CK203_012154 [Vitis vinifera]
MVRATKGLRFMEEHKMRYLLRLLGSRTPENAEQAEDLVPQVHQAILLEDLEGAMSELEQCRELNRIPNP